MIPTWAWIVGALFWTLVAVRRHALRRSGGFSLASEGPADPNAARFSPFGRGSAL